jgi:hypothetical protein
MLKVDSDMVDGKCDCRCCGRRCIYVFGSGSSVHKSFQARFGIGITYVLTIEALEEAAEI